MDITNKLMKICNVLCSKLRLVGKWSVETQGQECGLDSSLIGNRLWYKSSFIGSSVTFAGIKWLETSDPKESKEN